MCFFTYFKFFQINRLNLSTVDTTDKDFITQSGVPMALGWETHGGDDVAVYAQGKICHFNITYM